jgi:hypothetical protein
MTPRTSQCEVFWALLSSSKHLGILEDFKPTTFPSVGLHPHTWPKWGCDIIFSYPYANNALTTHNQCGFYGLRQVLHFAPFKQCALIIIMWVLLHGVLQNIIWIFKVMLYYLVYKNLVHIFQNLRFIL